MTTTALLATSCLLWTAPSAIDPEPGTLAAGTALQGNASQTECAPLLDHRELGIAIHRLETEFPELVHVITLGSSRAGRKIEALRLLAGERGPGRPAILIVANIDGPLVYTSGIALDHARKLAEAHGSDAEITALLESTTIYIVPRANPDGAEARFENPLHEAEATGHDFDTDRDGRVGEDVPEDVNGDGLITSMRYFDPEGKWVEDETDPRVMVEADATKGQRGRWKLVTEGRDTDGDGEVSEDALDARVNRNFPYRFEEHEPQAGLFATDEPEARALAEFVLTRKDIALVVCYGFQDNLVEKPKGVGDERVKRVPKPGVLESDAELLARIGERYREITGNKTKGQAEERGSFQSWCYAHRGLLTLNAMLWSLPEEDPERSEEEGTPTGSEGDKSDKDDKLEPSADAKRLTWIDANAPSRFVPWRAFEHPELGVVDIGGFAPYALTEPLGAERMALAEKNLAFIASLGDLVPRLKLVDCTAKDLGSGLFEVEVAVENVALAPLQTAAGVRSRSIRPARVILNLPERGRLLAGKVRELVPELGGSGGRKEFRWLVDGVPASSISISVDSDNAGNDRILPEVQQ